MSDIIDCENWPVGVASLGIPDKFIKTWSGMSQEEKNKEKISPSDFTTYAAAEASTLSDILFIPSKSSYTVTDKPVKPVYGYGEIVRGGNTYKGFGIQYNVARSCMYGVMTDPIPTMGYPSEGGQYTVALGVGGIPDYLGLSRVTAVGSSNLIKAVQVDRCEAFGNGALHYMRRGQRNTAIGTIALEWFGTTDPQADNNPFWFYNNGTAIVTPSDPSWNFLGLETDNPGIRAKIAAITMPTTSEEAMRTVAVGRDAFNNLLKGTNNIAVGYGAGGAALTAEWNVCLGSQCLNSTTLTRQMTGVGGEAGAFWHEGERSIVVGYRAGYQTKTGINSVNIGVFSGSDCTQQTNNVFIGNNSGNRYSQSSGITNVSNILEIGSLDKTAFSGNFSTNKYGVNTTADKLQATFHIVSSLTTATGATGTADDLLIENDGPCGVTIRSGTGEPGNIAFANPAVAFNGGILYDHAANTLKLRTGVADRVVVSNTGFTPNNDNAYTLGAASSRWSVVHAGTGAISTSDLRSKEQITDLSDVEKQVALSLKPLVKKYKFKDAVAEKGDSARWHIGVIAQEVIAAFESKGLDAFEYGIVCFDEWDEQPEVVQEWDSEYDDHGKMIVNGGSMIMQDYRPAGNRYAIRYDELIMFIISSI